MSYAHEGPHPPKRVVVPVVASRRGICIHREATARVRQAGMRCWGAGEAGVLGLGLVDDIGDDEPILDVSTIPLEEAAERVALGSSHACALTRDGDVRCWGDPRGAVLGTWPELEHCNVEEPNPNADALCEPATIQVFHCETERSCCVGDDESAASAIIVPL